MKPIVWKGTALTDVKSFPKDARRDAGYELTAVQQGKEPSDWKPMPSIGQGVKEIRIKQDNQYRIIYIAKFSEAVYVLHAFVKKKQKTAKQDINIAKARLQEIIKTHR